MRARVRIGIPERFVLGVGIMVALWISPAAAQTYDTLTPQVREFVSVGAPLIALTLCYAVCAILVYMSNYWEDIIE